MIEKELKDIHQQIIHRKLGITHGLFWIETTKRAAQQGHFNKKPQFFILETRELGVKGKKDQDNTC